MRSLFAHLSKRRIICLPATITRHSYPATTSSNIKRNCKLTHRNRGLHFFIASPVSLHRIYFSTSPTNGPSDETLETTKRKARELLSEQLHPPGSFTARHFKDAELFFDLFKKERAMDANTVNLAISLLERLVAELAITNDESRINWLCNPRYNIPIFSIWNNASNQGQAVVSPKDLLQKLQTMSSLLPEFRFTSVTVGIIMDALIKHIHPTKAPFPAEELLNFTRQEAARTKNIELRPDVILYSIVLRAWAVSGLPEAPKRVDALLESMRREGVALDIITYTIVLRFWAGQNNLPKVEGLLESMKAEGLEPTISTLSSVVYAYANLRMLEKAEEIFQRMLELEASTRKEVLLVGECAQNMLIAYRKIIDSKAAPDWDKEKALKSAKELYRCMKKRGFANKKEICK